MTSSTTPLEPERLPDGQDDLDDRDLHRGPEVPHVTDHPLRRLWQYAGHHRPTIVKASTFSILNKLFDLAPPFLIGAAVDIVVQREGSMIGTVFNVTDLRTQLIVLAAINALVWILESVFEYAFSVTWRNLAQTIQHEARLDAYAHTQKLELAYFEDRSTGGLMAVLNDDVNQLERFLDRGANDILQVMTTVLAIGISFFFFAPTIAPLAFAPIPVILWGSFRFQRKLEPKYALVRDRVGLLNSSLSNNLGGIATIKAFVAEQREIARISSESDDYRLANRAAIHLSSMFVPLIRMAILAGFIATLVLGGLMALDGRLDVGVYSVMVFITQRLLWPLTRLGETFDDYQRAMASVRRLMDLLAVKPQITPGPVELPDDYDADVAFDDVRFSYPSGGEVLHGLTLKVPNGQTHAIVGSTGAGKSTIVKLLLRLYEPTSGHIRIAGEDIADLTFESLRGAIGLVSQDTFLFHGTVRENVLYGRPDASEEDLVRACELAEADDFIRGLAHGYDTVVGERGQKLSGGQRQRLSIARAILKDPAILVLDEATSSVDNETEAAIQRSLARVARDRTTIVIAHRLSTVRHAHRIHVLEAGEVVEEGTHEELLDLGGRYAALWKVQTGDAAVPA